MSPPSAYVPVRFAVNRRMDDWVHVDDFDLSTVEAAELDQAGGEGRCGLLGSALQRLSSRSKSQGLYSAH